MDEAEIIRLYEERSETAIRETERRFGPYLRTIAHNVLGNREDAGECVNDTLLAAWNAIPPAKPDSLSAFLGRIVRKKAIDRLRTETRQKRNPSQGTLSLSELEECIPSGAQDPTDQIALTDAISEYLQTLSRNARVAFVGRYYYLDSLEEISRYTGVRMGALKSLLFRTRQGLKSHLEKEGLL